MRLGRVEEVSGDLLEDRGIGRRDAQLAQLDLGRGPGEVERALRRVRIVIAAGQLEGALPGRRHQGGERHRRGLARLQPHARPQREDRIEDRAGRSRERTVLLQRHRVAHRSPPAEEAGAVGLAAHRADPFVARYRPRARTRAAARSPIAGAGWR